MQDPYGKIPYGEGKNSREGYRGVISLAKFISECRRSCIYRNRRYYANSHTCQGKGREGR